MARRSSKSLSPTGALVLGATAAAAIGGTVYFVTRPAKASVPSGTGTSSTSLKMKPKRSLWEGNWAGPIAVAGLGAAGLMVVLLQVK